MKLKDKEIISIDGRISISILDWVLGNYCNFKCSYCFPNLNTGTNRAPSLDNNLKKNICHLVDQIKNTGKKHILFSLSGGEPTLYHDIKNLMKFLKPMGFIAFVSNGSRTVRWWKENSELIDTVIFSYHSEFTDLKHMVNVTNALLGKVNLSIHIMINPPLFDKCIDAYKTLNNIFKEEPVNFQFKLLREKDNVVDYTQEQKETIEYWSKYFSSSRPKYRMAGLTSWSIMDCEGEKIRLKAHHIKDLHGDFTGYECFAHHDFLQIDYRGYLGKMSCGQQFTTISNIYSENFIDTFSLPKQKVICEQKICGCLGLLFARKKKKNYG